MGEEDSKAQQKEEAPGKSIGEVLGDIRSGLVSFITHIHYGVQKVKTVLPTAAIQEGTERVFSPIEDFKLNIEQGVLCYSRVVNEKYPFLSSMAKSHQGLITAQVGIGSGILATAALKNVVKRRARLFVGVSVLMAADTYAFCEVVKFQEKHKRIKVHQVHLNKSGYEDE